MIKLMVVDVMVYRKKIIPSRYVHLDPSIVNKWTYVVLANGRAQVHSMVELSRLKEEIYQGNLWICQKTAI